MLFDLQGKRRRVVQGTYLTLAVLMGGGLVLFGIGGDVSGGLFDAISGNSGGGSGDNSQLEKRLERDQKRAAANPRSELALKALVRDNYQLATAKTGQGATGFSGDAKKNLVQASAAWKRYVVVADKPDPSLANVALQVFDVSALNKPKEAQRAASIVAEATSEPAAYIRLVQYATLAKDTRTAELAGQKAEDLAPKSQKKAVRDQVKQAKAPTAGASQGGAPAGG
jgi:hypothetical protein